MQNKVLPNRTDEPAILIPQPQKVTWKARGGGIVLTGALLLGIFLSPSTAIAEPTEEEIQADIDERQSALETVIEDYNAKSEELEDADTLIAEIEAALPAEEEALADSTEQIADIITMAHVNGQTSYINAILTDSTGDIADKFVSLDFLTTAENEQLEGYVTSVSTMGERKTELETLRDNADTLMADLETKKTTIETEVADLEVQLAEVTAPEPDPVDTSTLPTASGDNASVVDFAYAQLGEPYVWGAEGPDGWDCSGLVLGAWATAGVSLPHNVVMQWDTVAHVSQSELQPGDIVFYSGLGHNGLYIGDGQVIHAPQTGDVVKVAPMDMMAIAGYGRP